MALQLFEGWNFREVLWWGGRQWIGDRGWGSGQEGQRREEWEIALEKLLVRISVVRAPVGKLMTK